MQLNQKKKKKKINVLPIGSRQRLGCGCKLSPQWEVFACRYFFENEDAAALFIPEVFEVWRSRQLHLPPCLKLKWSRTDWTLITIFGIPSLRRVTSLCWCHSFLLQDFFCVCKAHVISNEPRCCALISASFCLLFPVPYCEAWHIA